MTESQGREIHTCTYDARKTWGSIDLPIKQTRFYKGLITCIMTYQHSGRLWQHIKRRGRVIRVMLEKRYDIK